ncbi:MAG: hypothetical protein QX199_03385 [Methylococcaceae bacterium]
MLTPPRKSDRRIRLANWGLLSADRKPIFPLTGPVCENPDWPLRFTLTKSLWLVIVAVYYKKLQGVSWPRLLVFLTLTQALSVCLIILASFLWYTPYSYWQRAYTLFIVAANTALAGLLMHWYWEKLKHLWTGMISFWNIPVFTKACRLR